LGPADGLEFAAVALPAPVAACRLPAVNRDALLERIAKVRARIEEAAGRAGRDPGAVLVLPITKGHGSDAIRMVAGAGFDRVGENRVDETERKQAELADLGLTWHMVGHLQRNKASRAASLFDVIESVDSLRLARRLALEAQRVDRATLPVLVQVNASGEQSKGGFDVREAPAAVAEITDLGGLEVRGLMTMAPWTDDSEVLRATFRTTRDALARCRDEVPGFRGTVLSMGMSNDFEIAVEEGSTELRLGTVLVGERPER
jgi:pyridoxal phosphate enzyme (YggS family)